MASALGVPSASHSHSTSSKITFPLETTPELFSHAADEYCTTSYSAVKGLYPKDNQPKDVVDKMCFVGSFAYSFLVDGLHIPRDKKITIQKEVNGNEIEWALGAAYKEAAGLIKRSNLRPIF